MSECRSCRASIIWTATEKGGRIPLDAAPYEDVDDPGNLYVFRHDDLDRVFALAVTPDAFPDEPVYRSHFRTCPQASEWSRRGRR
jgi:hypothetical protein